MRARCPRAVRSSRTPPAPRRRGPPGGAPRPRPPRSVPRARSAPDPHRHRRGTRPGRRARRPTGRSPRTAARLRRGAGVARGWGPELANQNRVAPGQLVPHAELGGRHDPRDLAADRRGRLLPAGELRLDPTLPYDRVATHAQERQQVLDHLAERTDGARGRNVVALTTRLREQLSAFVAHLDVRQSEQAAHLFEEARLLPHRLDERHMETGLGDTEREAGKPCAAADIDDAFFASPAPCAERGPRIEEVLVCDVDRFGDRGEVHGRIALYELLGVSLAHRDLLG